MLFSECKKHKVVASSSAETVGRVDDLVLDTRAKQVVAVLVKKSQGEGDTLHWQDIASFGSDAVMVSGPDALQHPSAQVEELEDKRNAWHNKRILDAAGRELGSAADVEFDQETGRILSLRIKRGGSIAGDRLIATGSYAVMVVPGAESDPAATGADPAPG